MQCWQDIAQFQQFLMAMLSQMGPYPMQGVTDGSDAKPGMIGEYVTGAGSLNYAANPAVTTGTVSPLVLSPGDWNITTWLYMTSPYGEAAFWLDPRPVGNSNLLRGAVAGVTAISSVNTSVVVGQTGRGSYTVPTLLAFSVTIDQSTSAALTAGTASVVVEARRMR
jgi:hypothetical protein